MTPQRSDALVFALPKGRILDETLPLLIGAGIRPEPAFFDPKSRMLQFETNREDIRLVRVRSFDVPAFVASGAAAMGVAGSDVLEEHGYDNIYSPLDLHIGKCRLSEAAPVDCPLNLREISHIRIATKYPALTKAFYAARGIQAECIKLHGAMELAPCLGMCDRIVDLVSTGATLRENRLKETETIMNVTSRLAVNRSCYTLYAEQINGVVAAFEEGVRRAAA